MSGASAVVERKPQPTRDGYGKGLLAAGRKNTAIVALDADLAESTRSRWFGNEFPDRFFQMGISEQDMIATAAGFASAGKIPFASTFAIFTERAFEQFRNAVARPNMNVKLVGSHGGIMTGEDGSSAHAIVDVAIYRSLPNVSVLVPADVVEAEKAVYAMAAHDGPCYMKLTRANVPVLFGDDHDVTIGKGTRVREGGDVTIAACGALVGHALEAAKLLAGDGIEADVLNMVSIKPLDDELLLKSAEKTGRVMTCEDHSVIGGLGGAVSEFLGEARPTPIRRIGLPDRFAESGSPAELYEKYGFTGKALAAKAKEFIKSTR
jgi:transketolase